MNGLELYLHIQKLKQQRAQLDYEIYRLEMQYNSEQSKYQQLVNNSNNGQYDYTEMLEKLRG